MVAPGQRYVPTVAAASSRGAYLVLGSQRGVGVAYLEQLQTVGVITRPGGLQYCRPQLCPRALRSSPKSCNLQKYLCGLWNLTWCLQIWFVLITDTGPQSMFLCTCEKLDFLLCDNFIIMNPGNLLNWEHACPILNERAAHAITFSETIAPWAYFEGFRAEKEGQEGAIFGGKLRCLLTWRQTRPD